MNKGFTLLEVVISLSIVVVLAVSLTSLIRTSIDIQTSMGENAVLDHRLNLAMQHLVRDLSHSFTVDMRDLARAGDRRRRKQKGIFILRPSFDFVSLHVTTFAHEARTIDAKESDSTLIAYEVEDTPGIRSTKGLYRREWPRVVEDYKNKPAPKDLLLDDLQVFKIQYWRGDAWSSDVWDSEQRDKEGKLPPMLKIELAANKDVPQYLETIVYLPLTGDIPEERQNTAGSIRWDRL